MAEAKHRWIVCEEYAAGPFGEAAAVGRLAQIEASQAQGDRRTCRSPHSIVTSEVKPKTCADRQDAAGAHVAGDPGSR